jgi:predicted small secreted protein
MKALVAVLMAALLCACNREGSGGPAEKAGRSLDRAMDKAGQAVEKAGRDIQDASKGKK